MEVVMTTNGPRVVSLHELDADMVDLGGGLMLDVTTGKINPAGGAIPQARIRELFAPDTKVDHGGGWMYDLHTGGTDKGGKFYAMEYDESLGYRMYLMVEEPSIEPEADGLRVVGYVHIEVDTRGLVHVSRDKSVDGLEFLRIAKTASLSNPTAALPDLLCRGYMSANGKRASGVIAVYVEHGVDSSEGIWMDPEVLSSNHGDGNWRVVDARSVAAVGMVVPLRFGRSE
jgi:hypothetical protein